MTTAIITAILSAAASFVGAWLAARFALDRFRHEEIWERRAAAYTLVFEALHDMQVTIEEAGPSEDNPKTLEDAIAALTRRVDSEAWLVSSEFRDRLVQEAAHTWDLNEGDWRERFLRSLSFAINDLRSIAKKDLSVR